MRYIKLYKTISLFLVMAVMLCSLNIIGSTNVYAVGDEYDNLRAKWKEVLTGGTVYNINDLDISEKMSAITTSAQGYWNTMLTPGQQDYLWSDLTDWSQSSTITNHYTRLKAMALAYCTKGSALEGNATLLSDIISGMDWMYENKYNENTSRYDNWWNWDIGSPQRINDIVVLLYEHFTSQQITNYMNGIENFVPDPTVSNGITNVGANRVDTCKVVAIRGVIVKDSTKIASARDALSDVFLYVTTADGFYTDGSFVQHTDVAYNCSYGTVLLRGVTQLMYLLNGSTWAVTDINKSNVYAWVYDSFEPFIYKGAAMDMVRGRAISREQLQDHTAGHDVIAVIAQVASFAPVNDAATFKAMVKYWVNEDAYASIYNDVTIFEILTIKNIINDSSVISRGDLIKHKQFANMDRTVHLRPGFGYGISMFSNRIQTYEDMNNENRHGWYTGSGMTYLYNSDLSQYSDGFWPTVNPYRMPGTTVDTMTMSDGAGEFNSPHSWVGGTSIDDTYGVTGMQLATWNATLVAKKSWFMFDDEIVALGAGITSTDGRPIETIIENRKINIAGDNSFTVNGVQKQSTLGWSETMTNVNWAQLSGNTQGADIGYYFPNSSSIKALREERTGAWSDINYQGPTDVITRKYLTMWFDHGSNPTNATYAYVLLPNKTSSSVNSYATNPDITILENSSQAQVVKENTLNVIGANFWEDTAKTVGIISSNKKAAIMTKEIAQDIEISVSDPTMLNTGTIYMQIDRTASAVISSDPAITVEALTPSIKLSINVNGAKGKEFKAKFSLASQQLTPDPFNPDGNGQATTSVLQTIDDTYVRGGNYADTNYGSVVKMVTKTTTNIAYTREAFVKFDLSGITGTISSAKVKLYVTYTNTSPSTQQIEKVTNDTWSETTLTWNNKPTSTGTVLGTAEPVKNTFVEIDVTSAVQAEFSGDKVISFKVSAADLNAGDITYAAKEHATVSYRPVLEVIHQ